jgi:hypothetical protein
MKKGSPTASKKRSGSSIVPSAELSRVRAALAETEQRLVEATGKQVIFFFFSLN